MRRKLSKGDYIVCICKDWRTFTYGKLYQLMDEHYTDDFLVDVLNDEGERCKPAYATVRGKKYFVTIEEWREMQIDKLI